MNAEQIKERTDELVKSIHEVIENGTLIKDDHGHVGIELNDIRAGLQNTWFDNSLNNHFVVTSYERDKKVLRELETLSPLSNDYKGNSNYSALNLNENNLTKENLKSQEPLSEQANAEKLAKLESEQLESGNKIFDFYSDRNFTDFRDARPQPSISKDSRPLPTTLNEPNLTQNPLTSQENLLKTQENPLKTQDLSLLEQSQAEKLAKLKDAITPLKEFGTNYPEFALKPKEALEKLLQEQNGQVAGAAYRDDLGGIDFVWGNKDYGLEHILKRREGQAIAKGLNEAEAKEYALNVVKSIPEIIEKGVKVDNNGRIAIEYQHMRVGLNDKWDNKKLENKWVISSYEIYNSESGIPFRPISQLQEVGLEPSKLTEPNLNTNATKTQDLSPLEQAQAEKLAKLESEKWIKEAVSKKSAEKTENQFTLKQRLTRRTLSTLSFHRIAKNAKKQ